MGFLETFITIIMDSMYGSSYIESAEWGAGILQRVLSMAQSTIGSSRGMHALYSGLMGFGYALVTLLFFIAITDSAVNGKLTFEYFVKNSIRAVVACFLIYNGFDILIWISKVASLLLDRTIDLAKSVGGVEIPYTYAKYAIIQYGASVKFGDRLGMFFHVIIPFIMCWVVKIVIQMTLLVVSLEVVVRAILAPIAFADVFGDSLRPHAVRYLKQFAATCLQFACIVGIIMAFNIINSILVSRDDNMAAALQKMEAYASAFNVDQDEMRETLKAIIFTDELNIIPNEIDRGDDDVDAEGEAYSEEEVDALIEGMESDNNTQTMAALKAASGEMADDGKALFTSIFSMSKIIGFIAISLGLTVAIAKSKDIANLIVGV